ncbi:MAG: acyltransferase family protein [Bacteriovoracaceae bacterium]
MSRKIADIERLRAVAVIMVIISHVAYFGHYLKPLFRQTWSGVDLFFVISGCVVSLSLLHLFPKLPEASSLSERIGLLNNPLKLFFLKRLLRITPMAVIWAIIPLTLAFTFNQSGAFVTKTFYQAFNQLMAILTLQFNYIYIYDLLPHEMGYYWSLAVEEHFYLLLPLLFLFVPTSSGKIKWSIILITLTTFVIRPLLPHPSSGTDNQTTWFWYRFASHNRFDSLLLGVVIGLMRFELKPEKKEGSWALIVLMLILTFFLCLVPAMEVTVPLYHFQITILNLICFLMVFFASLDRNIVFPLPLVDRVLVYLGSRSYALYLVHYPAYKITDEIFFRLAETSIAAKLVVFIVLMMALTELSYRFIEVPFIGLGKRWGKHA